MTACRWSRSSVVVLVGVTERTMAGTLLGYSLLQGSRARLESAEAVLALPALTPAHSCHHPEAISKKFQALAKRAVSMFRNDAYSIAVDGCALLPKAEQPYDADGANTVGYRDFATRLAH